MMNVLQKFNGAKILSIKGMVGASEGKHTILDEICISTSKGEFTLIGTAYDDEMGGIFSGEQGRGVEIYIPKKLTRGELKILKKAWKERRAMIIDAIIANREATKTHVRAEAIRTDQSKTLAQYKRAQRKAKRAREAYFDLIEDSNKLWEDALEQVGVDTGREREYKLDGDSAIVCGVKFE